MPKVKKAYIGILALCLLAGPASGQAAAPAAAVKVEGRIMLGESITMLMLNVLQGGAPLTGLRVKVAERPAEDLGDGRYRLFIQEALGVPGKVLQVTIEPPLLSGQSFAAIKATANVAQWVRITEPANGAHADAGASDLVVAWGGGYGPYNLLARPEDQPAEYVYEEYGILANQKSIPMSHFSKGKRYLLNVGFEAKDFILAGPVERGSRIALIERSKPVRINID